MYDIPGRENQARMNAWKESTHLRVPYYSPYYTNSSLKDSLSSKIVKERVT